MTAGRGATIARTSYNLPSAITNGSISTQFFYAPDRSYWKQVAAYTGGTETTLYLGGILEKVTRANGTTDWRHRISTPGASSALYIRQSGGTNLTYSIAGDHLGSTSVVTDAAQALVVSESFGAFGARRGSNWQGTPSAGDLAQIEATTRRGFTDHTMVDNLNLIHMNGRMYDPVIGRFLSADPYPLIGRVALADPAGLTTDVTQAFNRYAYVDNNPLSYTDPSGFEAAAIPEITVTGHPIHTGGAGSPIVLLGADNLSPAEAFDGTGGVGAAVNLLRSAVVGGKLDPSKPPRGVKQDAWKKVLDFWSELYGDQSDTQQQSGQSPTSQGNGSSGGGILTLPELVVTPGTTLSSRVQQGAAAGAAAVPLTAAVGAAAMAAEVLKAGTVPALLSHGELLAAVEAIAAVPEAVGAGAAIGITAAAPLVVLGVLGGAAYFYFFDLP